MRWIFVLVFFAAIVMGAPSLPGAFLRGDDIQLVRDHVLVNRPSLAHFLKLFAVEHRDLYQPVALASFQFDFALVQALGLQPVQPSEVPGVWVFHLTNVLLHGVCAALVCALARRVTGQVAIAAVVGGLFALHPLNVEAVAWINGRMMLLSTLFLLAALLMLERFGERGGVWRGVAVILFAALCHLSKVRPEMPVLLIVPLLVRGQWPARRWWWAWTCASLVTATLILVNLGISSEMLAAGAEQLHGSRLARSVLALGWYVSRIFVPVGLSPYHPTSPTVDWTHAEIPFAATIVALALAGVLVSLRRTRAGWAGALWMLVALAATLPLTSARNLAVAERYMYLPLAGALWPLAVGLIGAARRMPRVSAPAAGAALAVAMIAASWRTIGYFRNDLAMTGRMAALYSDDPRMRLAHADALLQAGRPAEARGIAEALTHAPQAEIASEAWQCVGQACTLQHEDSAALSAFREAVTVNPDSGLARVRLGRALLRAGDLEEGLSQLEAAAERAPLYNPGLHDLAGAYRRAARTRDAERVYRQILENNPYDPMASAGLGELAIAARHAPAAVEHLQHAVSLMPHDPRLRALCAWALFLNGDWGAAAAEIGQIGSQSAQLPLARAVAVGLALSAGDFKQAIARTTDLARAGELADPRNFDAFAGIVQSYSERRADDPWPYYVMALACHAAGREDAAQLAAEAFKQHSPDADWHTRLDAAISTDSSPN